MLFEFIATEEEVCQELVKKKENYNNHFELNDIAFIQGGKVSLYLKAKYFFCSIFVEFLLALNKDPI